MGFTGAELTKDRGAARSALRRLLSHDGSVEPFPWQDRLLDEFLAGRVPSALDVPTGLGKTAVIPIWLAARAGGAIMPRRLVYVVDRRAVVDQSTRVAEELRATLADDADLRQRVGLPDDGRPLPISTLRGRFVDNREWLEDPSSPAIIVGTVDMIGSRLLFEGYGTSRRMRPFHAALLACDSLVVLDEAHLVPPFARLCADLAETDALDAHDADHGYPRAPRMRWMALSATGRHGHDDDVFTLADDDREHDIVARRLGAEKRAEIVTVADDEAALVDGLVQAAVARLDDPDAPARMLVFANRREHAEKVAAALDKLTIDKTKRFDVELFVGARRIRERSNAARRLVELGFLAGSDAQLERPAVLVATSAAEVGVDLDADHMVADVVSWERMVQRLGRVNRRGEGAARITLVATNDQRDAASEPAAAGPDAGGPENADRSEDVACLALLDRLPTDDAGRIALSPGDIVDLSVRARTDEALASLIRAATTAEPLRPAVTLPLLESWAMTSLDEHTGRPEVAPWLRGWEKDDKPRTNVVWRHHLPEGDDDATRRRLGELFRAAPVQTSERLEAETFQVAEWLEKRRKRVAKNIEKDAKRAAAAGETPTGDARQRDPAVVLLDGRGEVVAIKSGEELSQLRKADRERLLAGRTLVVRDVWGGLASGLLHDKHDEPAPAIDAEGLEDGWLAGDDPDGPGAPPPFRIRRLGAGEDRDMHALEPGWIEIRRIALDDGERADEDTAPPRLVVEIPVATTTDEESRAAGNPQRLAEHQSWAAEHAERLARRLGLDDHSRDLLCLAARLHDEGKRADVWQRAFSAPDGGDWAKTRGPVNPRALEGYRHELGSYLRVVDLPELRELDEIDRDLVLHLIASHHGHARPVLRTDGCKDAAPSALRDHAADIAERYVRLQRRLGVWQLAWWETLLRAADQQASRANDARIGERIVTSEAVA